MTAGDDAGQEGAGGQAAEYVLTKLAAVAGVTPRAIRFYVEKGLLPAPELRGARTRYGEEHLLRLRVIRRLQVEERLRLEQIAHRMHKLSAVELAALAPPPARVGARAEAAKGADATEPAGAEGAEAVAATKPVAVEAAEAAVATKPVAVEAAEAAAAAEPAAAASAPVPVTAEIAGASSAGAAVPTGAKVFGATDGMGMGGERWERVALLPGLELHVRSDATALVQRLVAEIVAQYGAGLGGAPGNA